jgi:SAM-dependent methyltransferase
MDLFSKTAEFYDKIYAAKDYRAEVERLLPLVRQHLRSDGNRLLDVGCGTGKHILYLKDHFACAGLDISPEFVALARARHPDLTFHLGDMIDFELGEQFDVVVNLFSSIGYVRTVENLNSAVHSMARHLNPGGLLVVEPWFTPETWKPRNVHGIFVDEPELKIARVNSSFTDGRISWFDLHYLIGTPEGTSHHVEHHELGLFTIDEMHRAFEAAGLMATYDRQGLTGRGLYLGQKP